MLITKTYKNFSNAAYFGVSTAVLLMLQVLWKVTSWRTHTSRRPFVLGAHEITVILANAKNHQPNDTALHPKRYDT